MGRLKMFPREIITENWILINKPLPILASRGLGKED
jgi:hypothetical protein